MTTHIFTGTAVKEIDRVAIEEFGYDAYGLMTRAGERAYRRIDKYSLDTRSMLVLCGVGNNGGDGYILASAALEAGWQVTVYASGTPKTPSARRALARYVAAGGEVLEVDDNAIVDFDVAVVVDALLGVGLTTPPRAVVAKLVNLANQSRGLRVALDVPTGLDADTGEVFEPCFEADKTITFIDHKFGLMTGPACSYVGNLSLERLDVEQSLSAIVEYCAALITKPKLAKRVADSHKGSYGTTVIMGGDVGMLGAVLLAGAASLRTGAGKVRIASTSEHLDTPALWMPELMSETLTEDSVSNLDHADAVAFGPGLGQSAWARSVFDQVIKLKMPMVLDADGLNLLAIKPSKAPKSNWVLTPHPGEAARLLACTTSEIQKDRRTAAIMLAQRYNAVVVLKGAGTLVANPAGRVELCDLGNPGMATAGTGDVLTGIIVALLGRQLPLFDAACSAVWLHARAADLQVAQLGEEGLVASDVIHGLAAAFADARVELGR
ncbi:NAD(P)H-hydrate dehydratase [Arenicella xantha]|uniref:Bifunctional NAD(P)H-hydrate repair enzyme n=1 Tax=Arenicella xantha TaxID=644221 RepID=A0A395JP88_9GAMM|nr:NAD(P)H-hydrate dehydratase [Arenicella xantha]RBP51607.1 NAD(P)H-hydrate epimerase [Arenicella xantha]